MTSSRAAASGARRQATKDQAMATNQSAVGSPTSRWAMGGPEVTRSAAGAKGRRGEGYSSSSEPGGTSGVSMLLSRE